MNIFHKIAWQGLVRNRTRTIVTIIGAALSTAMIAAVFTFAVSLQNYMVNGAVQKYGSWHAAFSDVDSAFVQEQAKDDRVADIVTYNNIGYAEFEGGENPDKPYLFLAGFNRKTFDTLPVTLISGRMPENSREILVPAHVAANGGVRYSVGDMISLNVGDRVSGNEELNQHDSYTPGHEMLTAQDENTYTVVGICTRPSFEEYTAPGYTLITTADETKETNHLSLFITLKKPGQVRAYVNEAGDGLGFVLNDDVLRFMGLSEDTMFNTLLYSIGGVLVGLVMLGAVFLICNSFMISLNDRTLQLGILLSVGATGKQLRNSVLFEGLCIGAIGIPIGIFAGLSGITLVLSRVTENFANILYDSVPLTLTVSLPVLAVAVAVSLITILVSAYIPARKAVKTPVMDCIRQTNEVKIEPEAIKVPGVAARLYGLEGTLALKNFKRNKRRYRSIVLSLTLSIVLFVSANAFGINLKRAAEQSVVDSDYDICFYSQDMDEGGMSVLYDELKAVKGITESSYQAISTYSCAIDVHDFSDRYRRANHYDLTDKAVTLFMDIQFIEDSVYWQFVRQMGLSPADYTGPDTNMIVVAKGKDESNEMINIFAAESANVSITPKTINEESAGQKRDISITFADTYPLDPLPKPPSEVTPYTFTALVPYQAKGQFESMNTDTVTGLTFRSENPSRSSAEMEAVIQRLGITSEYTLYNVYGMLEQSRNIILVVDLFSAVFSVMIALIAVANVFNTISTNIRLRRRELAMLRSVGMSDRDFNRMMSFECVFYGMKTLAYGLPAAGILSWVIYKGFIVGGAVINFSFPWRSIGISIITVFFVIFVTMVYSIGKIRRENIIDALRNELT